MLRIGGREREPCPDKILAAPRHAPRPRPAHARVQPPPALAQQLAAARKALDKSFFSMVGCMIEQGDQSVEHVTQMLVKFG